ncbi:MAG: FAD-dependent oxidoreductase [Pseudomonadota bacterium]
MSRPRVAIVGAGPSGFFAAQELLDAPTEVFVDVFERLPVPFGLVRYGVAPDHPKLKSVQNKFFATAEDRHFNFFGNVEIGRDIELDELLGAYNAVILAIGAEVGMALGVPGEELPGCYKARDFVGWYNGHPDYSNLGVALGSHVTIVGNGNVALDVARLLLKAHGSLADTDIADYALASFRENPVEHVTILGRRGPAQTKFSFKDLHELLALPGVVFTASGNEPAIQTQATVEELNHPSSIQRRKVAGRLSSIETANPSGPGCHLAFQSAPVEILGRKAVETVKLAATTLCGPAFAQRAVLSEGISQIRSSALINCIGYHVRPLLEPSKTASKTISNQAGRVLLGEGLVPGLYVVGWAKRGAEGTIGANKACSRDTVKTLLEDLWLRDISEDRSKRFEQLRRRLRIAVSFEGWQRINEHEIALGRTHSPPKPRTKITSRQRLLEVANHSFINLPGE